MSTPLIDVLLLESDAARAGSLRRAIASELEGACRVTHAHGVDAALRRAALGRVDVILMDLDEPGGGGYDGFLRLRREAKDLPIVVLTQRADAELARRAVEQGARDCLMKDPLDGQALASALRYAARVLGRGI